MTEDASARGWGPGWPNCQVGKISTLTRKDGLRIPLRTEIISLVAWLIDETERRGYDVKPGQTWGYACRAIRGYNVPSNHSWGLAIDINAPTNPMGSTLITDMPRWMPELWAQYGFRWGGSYTGRKDAMHYEFMGTPTDAARYIAKIQAPVWTAPAYPGHVLEPGMHDPAVIVWKWLLKGAGFGAGIDFTTDVFGPATVENTKKLQDVYFQSHGGGVPDGKVGPLLWAWVCDRVKNRKAAGKA